MSVTDFNEANLSETLDYIRGNAEAKKVELENHWKVMRWQSALIVNMMKEKGKPPTQPLDLFTFDDEKQPTKVNINSEEAKRMFDLMEEKYKKKWQQQSEV